MSQKAWTESTVIGIDLKLFLFIIFFVASTVGGFYHMMGEVEKAKNLPEPGTGQYSIDRADPNAVGTWPPTKMEYQMKDETARQTLLRLQEEIEQLKTRVEKLEQERGN